MKVQYALTNFAGGEISPRLTGRTDIRKYATSCRTLENFDLVPHGGARKRSGTRHVADQPDDEVTLKPFVYSTEQAYTLMFGPNYVWFFKDQGIVTHPETSVSAITAASPPVVTATAHGLTTGDYTLLSGIVGMTELNNRVVRVTVINANSFSIDNVDASSFYAYVSGGTSSEVVKLTTTYTADECAELTTAQVYDTLYIAHRNHPLRKITRTSDTSWTLSAPTITTGPFRTINADTTLTMTPSAFSGAATAYGTHIVGETFTMTASSATFTESMVGALFRLNEEAVGVAAPPLGSTNAIANGNTYTNAGNVYGVANVTGTATWEQYTRVPDHTAGRVRVYQPTPTSYYDADFLHPGYCVVRITAYTSTTVVTAQIVRYQMPASIVSGSTSSWEEGAWSAYRGYAGAIAFYEQRLFLAGSTYEPSVIWGSRSGSYEDFTDGSEDDKAVVYRIAGGTADVIRWLQSGRVLMAGTSAGEYAVAASNQNEALTPTNFKAVPQTSYGTSQAHPVRINQLVLYPQRDGASSNAAKKLREFAYSFADDAFNSTDLTIFSEHIMGPGFNEVAYELVPDSVIWCLRTDGVLAACTYERAQEIIGWHRHTLGGDGLVKSMCVIPSDDGDELWLSVDRGGDRTIEVMLPPFEDDDDKEDAIFLDASLTYEGVSTTTLSGLWHLRGQAVKVLNNGSVESHTVTQGGRLTLNRAGTKIHVGYPYTATLETQDLEAGAQAGAAQSRAKRISQVYPRLLSSLGGSMGPDADNLKALLYRRASQSMGSSPPLFTGIVEDGVDFNSGWDREASIRIEHSDPLPFHVLALVAELSTSG
jgi:hypothetical protein